jgi:hypothetical protein
VRAFNPHPSLLPSREKGLKGENVAEEQSNTANIPLDRVTELEGLVARKDEELGKTTARVADMEQLVKERNTEINSLKQSAAELEEKQRITTRALTETVAGYKKLVVQINPGIMPELINGDSVAAIDVSLEKARNLVSQVRQSIEKEQSSARVPVGSPGRHKPDLGALSPREKIQYAIGGKQ